LREALAAGQLEKLLPDWSLAPGAVYWVTPPGGPRPKRVEVLADFLTEKLAPRSSRGTRLARASMLRPPGKAERS
jgi:DNA-binding transcriptional LysR family regulator